MLSLFHKEKEQQEAAASSSPTPSNLQIFLGYRGAHVLPTQDGILSWVGAGPSSCRLVPGGALAKPTEAVSPCKVTLSRRQLLRRRAMCGLLL